MWIARNKDGSLELFEGRPYRMDKDSVVPEEYREGHWAYYSLHSVIGPHTIQHFSSKMLDPRLFTELKWEDEPIEVSLVPKMMNSVQEKIAESVNNYFDYVGHAQDIHPYSKEKEQKLYDEMCWRWQDYNEVKYDPKDTWDLNFDDYE